VHNLNVIFDTNVYRSLSFSDCRTIVAQEDEQGVRPCLTYWPTLELAVHLADPADPAHKIARRSIAVLRYHLVGEPPEREVGFLADPDAELARTYFRVDVASRVDEAKFTSGAVLSIGTDTTTPIPSDLQSLLTSLKGHVETREAEFAAGMLAEVRKLDPSSTAWQPFPNKPEWRKEGLALLASPECLLMMARTRLEWTRKKFGIQGGLDQLTPMSVDLLRRYPTSLYFVRNVLIGLVQSGTNLSNPKHANSYWDLHLASSVSPWATYEGRPTILVTNERRIFRAAADAGHGAHVLTYTEYRTLLGRGGAHTHAEALRRL
jgi:hypothetical protein